MDTVANMASRSSISGSAVGASAVEGGAIVNVSSSTIKEPLAFSILWSPLPPITYLLPFIGHMGISDSRGVASDFQGPYSVGDRGQMAFGRPARALRIDLPETIDSELWDGAVREANEEYRCRMHNICCDNCHSHVAYALNAMGYRYCGVSKWDMVKLCFWVFFRARFLGARHFLHQFAPFATIAVLMILFL